MVVHLSNKKGLSCPKSALSKEEAGGIAVVQSKCKPCRLSKEQRATVKAIQLTGCTDSDLRSVSVGALRAQLASKRLPLPTGKHTKHALCHQLFRYTNGAVSASSVSAGAK